MKIKGIIETDFVNYKIPSMVIIFPYCSFKCDIENGCQLCQNADLAREPMITVDKEKLIVRYLDNELTRAIVCAGLEPLDSELDLISFLDCLRNQYYCNDTVVIYTGYTEEELEKGKWGSTLGAELHKNYWNQIKSIGNLIVKFGRFRPNEKPHRDNILGVDLASQNQYAKEYK